MKRRSRIKRGISLLLSLVLMLGSMTGNVAFASESNESEIVEVEAEYIRELTGQEVHGNNQYPELMYRWEDRTPAC